MEHRIIALVVSYNGGEDLLRTVSALIPQVQKVLVLDNNSNEENQKIIQNLKDAPRIAISKFDANMGIGYALNRGVEAAKAEEFDWVLTMDQDSIASPEMIANMLASAERVPGMKVVCPSIVLGSADKLKESDQVVGYSITSGNLIPVQLFDAVGMFNEDYFIDSVDFEFSLRVRNAGIPMIRCGCAKLHHKLGEIVSLSIGAVSYRYVCHSPLRRYYIYRNHMFLIADFWRKNPIFLAKKTIMLAFQFFEALIFDRKKKENLKMIALGLRDFFKGRVGKFGNS